MLIETPAGKWTYTAGKTLKKTLFFNRVGRLWTESSDLPSRTRCDTIWQSWFLASKLLFLLFRLRLPLGFMVICMYNRRKATAPKAAMAAKSKSGQMSRSRALQDSCEGLGFPNETTEEPGAPTWSVLRREGAAAKSKYRERGCKKMRVKWACHALAKSTELLQKV